ncbi:hypothetical protein [Pseudomonas baetica]|uniref:hypothetical protein n=1 Tax=Pseudomonas baetica TaxID=674054 RepID=UPI002405E05A|nr:hypothetical protein [Pseudomonas baetica]MDF9779008.1 hypothetical protein [Pseudomonas baetica]
MDSKTQKQFLDLLEGMPDGNLLQMHRMRLGGLRGQSVDMLMFGNAHPSETFSEAVALCLIGVLNKPLFPVFFDEILLYTCPESELKARCEEFAKLQEDATASYQTNMDALAAAFRPTALAIDDPIQRMTALYADGRCVDLRDIYSEGSDVKFATAALIADIEPSCTTWLQAAQGLLLPRLTSEYPVTPQYWDAAG